LKQRREHEARGGKRLFFYEILEAKQRKQAEAQEKQEKLIKHP